MPSPAHDCPDWEYRDHPAYPGDIVARIERELRSLLGGDSRTAARLGNTRPSHGRIFAGLTPHGFPQYAGHYRGDNQPCIREYEVMVVGAPEHVGYPPATVSQSMNSLAGRIAMLIGALDELFAVAAGNRVQALVMVGAWLLVRFTEIHPYANGNGHIARIIWWVLAVRYGFRPTNVPVEPRPRAEFYNAVRRYQNDDREPLERLLLEGLTQFQVT